jgi:predicted acylesterase/phospholipase RssA
MEDPMPTYRTFPQHLDPAIKPKRILALDGGGIRGLLTAGILRRLEDVLRARAGGDPGFRLSDYFDLIGGTSTGSIIAAGLSLGMSAEEVRSHYFTLGEATFKRSLFRLGAIRQKYDAKNVENALKALFRDRTLASGDFKTGLMVMSKRMDTGSPWPLSNNPAARYFKLRPNSTTIPNGEYPLWKVVRASTAAPYFFAPERIAIKTGDTQRGLKGVTGEFVDGGISTANNPSLAMVLMATIQGYHFNWEMGADQLLVVSLGTGRQSANVGVSEGLAAVSLAHAMRALASLMDDCGDLVETIMQWLSHSPTARDIDREMGKAEPALGGAARLSYLRYNVVFEADWFRANLGLDWPEADVAALAAMDEPENMDKLDAVGQAAGAKLVEDKHFPAAFDLK